MDINDTLTERGNRYGDFAGHAKITQGIKSIFTKSPKWEALTDSMKESLEMVAHKIGRILNGDPTYADSWHDIGGYVKLVEDQLAGIEAAPAATGWPPAPKAAQVAAPPTTAAFPVSQVPTPSIPVVAPVSPPPVKAETALPPPVPAPAPIPPVPPVPPLSGGSK